MIPIHTLAGPARECTVPRELRFYLPAWRRPEKPLWAVDEVFEVIGALQDAGAAVVSGEILAVSDTGVRQVPWEPWLSGAYFPDDPPATRHWCISRQPGESWDAFVARAAEYARGRVHALAGSARTTPAGTLHVDLSWMTEDELALWEVPAWVRPERRRLVEQGGTARDWYSLIPSRVSRAGPLAPGSYHGEPAEDLASIPADARFARIAGHARNRERLGELTRLEGLWAAGWSDRDLAWIGRLPRLRELYLLAETRITSLEPVTALRELEFAKVELRGRRPDPRPLQSLPALRYLYLRAEGLRDLSPLGGLTQLNSLHLIPRSVVDSLAPLSALTNLRYLSVWADFVRDGSAAPLAALKELRSLDTSLGLFPVEELAPLSVALPRTQGELRAPFLPSDDWVYTEPCWRCGRRALVTSAGRKRILCPECDAAAVQQHVIRWEIARSAAG